MRETISETIQRELRLAGLFTDREPRPPIPCDIDAEAELCSAAMCGEIQTTEVDLLASDFYSTFHRYAWVAIEAIQKSNLKPTESAVLAALRELGFSGPALDYELSVLHNGQPFALKSELISSAQRIKNYADVRRKISQLEQLIQEMRFGAPADYIRETLTKIASR